MGRIYALADTALLKANQTFQRLVASFNTPSYEKVSQHEMPLFAPTNPSRWPRWAKKFAAAVVATLLILWATHISFYPSLTASDPFVDARRQMTKEEYIEAVMREPVEGLVDLEPIRNRCRKAIPKKGLVWHCDYIQGGLGNLGNSWVGCMLFGIDSGATSIILPPVGIRDDNNLINNGNSHNTTDLSILYDIDYFMEQWSMACPNIQVYRTEDDVPGLKGVGGRVLTPHQIPDLELVRLTVVDVGSWRVKFDEWLRGKFPARVLLDMSPEQPVRVIAKGLLFAWHRASMDPDFAFAFARMFRFKPELRRLGAAALWGFEKAAGRPIVSDAILFPALYAQVYGPATTLPGAVNTSLVTRLQPHRVLADAFLGAHLRADSDAQKLHWPGYDAQVPVYLNEARQRNLTTIYLAAGTAASAAMFKADAAKEGLTVFTKEDVLGDEEMAAYDALTWDNRAVIDFQVLLHASFFAGFGQSTFSQTMAVRRSSLPEAGTNQMNPWRPFTNSSFEIYRDNLSSIICGLHSQTLDRIWP